MELNQNNEDLKKLIKAQEWPNTLLTTTFLYKEESYKKQLEELQSSVNSVRGAGSSPQSTEVPEDSHPVQLIFLQTKSKGTKLPLEAPTREPLEEIHATDDLSAIKLELQKRIAKELD